VASAISQLSVVAHSKPGFGLIGAVLSLTCDVSTRARIGREWDPVLDVVDVLQVL